MEMRCHFRSAQRGGELKSCTRVCVCVCTCVKLGLSLLSHSVYPDPAEGVDGLHLIQLRAATLAEKFRPNNRLSQMQQQKKRGQFERFRCSSCRTVNNKIVKNESPRLMFHFPFRGGVTFKRSTTQPFIVTPSPRRHEKGKVAEVGERMKMAMGRSPLLLIQRLSAQALHNRPPCGQPAWWIDGSTLAPVGPSECNHIQWRRVSNRPEIDPEDEEEVVNMVVVVGGIKNCQERVTFNLPFRYRDTTKVRHLDRGHNRWASSQNKLGSMFSATQKSFSCAFNNKKQHHYHSFPLKRQSGCVTPLKEVSKTASQRLRRMCEVK